MPRPQYRSRTFRRIFVRTPGSEVHMHYKRRKPDKAICAGCKKVLAGVPQVLPRKLQNMPKTQRRPERPYGGKLCSRCMRRLIIEKTRVRA